MSSCSVNVGGRKPTDFPSTNQYCMLGLSAELKSCGRNFFCDFIQKVPGMFGFNNVGIGIDNHGDRSKQYMSRSKASFG